MEIPGNGVETENWLNYLLLFAMISITGYLVRNWLRANDPQAMIPKDIKKRFKKVFGQDESNQSNENSRSEPMFNSNQVGPHDPESDSSPEERKDSDRAYKSPDMHPKPVENQGIKGTVDYWKAGLTKVASDVSNNVVSGVKQIKEKVVGKSAKKAKLVSDESDSDGPCPFHELPGSNQSKSPQKGFNPEQEETKRIWTPNGPVIVDKDGNRIASPNKHKETQDAQEDEESEESPVNILK